MATDIRRTRFNSEVLARGLGDSNGIIAGVLNKQQLRDVLDIADATGVGLKTRAVVADSYDTFVLAPAASQTNTITIVANTPGPGAGIVTVAISDNASDNLAVTVTAGAVAIALANATDTKNTLTLIKAALDAALTSTTGALYSTFITGTASTQMVHGGTNTVAATAAGGTAAGGIKSSTAGVAAVPSVAQGNFNVTTA